MATLRQQFKVWWDEGDKVTVLTTAKDLIDAVEMLDTKKASNQVAVNTCLIYCALVRNGYELKPYDDWLLELDNYEETKTVVKSHGPTLAAPSAIEPLLSLASQEQTGAAG